MEIAEQVSPHDDKTYYCPAAESCSDVEDVFSLPSPKAVQTSCTTLDLLGGTEFDFKTFYLLVELSNACAKVQLYNPLWTIFMSFFTHMILIVLVSITMIDNYK